MNKQYHRVGFRTWQTSTMEHFTKILSNWKTLLSFAKRPILDVWQGSKYASIISNIIVINWLIIYLSLLRRLPKCPSQECNHPIWYLLSSNLHPCLQDSDIGWNYMEEHLHRLASNIILFIFWTNTLEQGDQELPSNFFIFKIVSLLLPFCWTAYIFPRNICSLTSSIESHFFFPHKKHRYFPSFWRMLLFNKISVIISVSTFLASVLCCNSLKCATFLFLLNDAVYSQPVRAWKAGNALDNDEPNFLHA